MTNFDFEWQIDEYMIYCRSKKLREKTLTSYEQTLRLFAKWCEMTLAITEVNKITESVVRRYINDLQERGKYTIYVNDDAKKINYPERRRDYRNTVSDITINNYIRNLRAFFNWLDRDYLLTKNPMKRIQQIKVNRKAKAYISDEDFKRLTSLMDKSYFPEHRDFAMIYLMLDSGMRLGECSVLLVTDVELAQRRIMLRADITKGRKDRVVFFSKKTELILRRWMQFKDRYVESDYLFPVKSTGASVGVSNFETNFKSYIRRAGIDENISPHCIRNNFAKRCLMSGMDLYTLSKLLGHSSVTVTEQAYLDLNDEDLGKRYQNFSPISNM